MGDLGGVKDLGSVGDVESGGSVGFNGILSWDGTSSGNGERSNVVVTVVGTLDFDGEKLLVRDRFFDGEEFLVLRTVTSVGVSGAGLGESMSPSEGGSRMPLRFSLPGGVLVNPSGAIMTFLCLSRVCKICA